VALSEKHRSVIYAHLVEHVGEEAAEAMLAQFPSRDLDEPVTKEFVALQIAELRTEMHQEFGILRADLHQKLSAQDDRFESIRGEMHQLTERLMNRVQLMAGLVVVALAIVGVLTR
jgi:hypothetical protein